MTTEMDALPDFRELTKKLGVPDSIFDAWRDATSDQHWARFDLSALRIGYELGRKVCAARVQELERENAGLCEAHEQACNDRVDEIRKRVDAESELAAIKKGIAEARIVVVDVSGGEVWLDGDDYGGKRVALLPLDDEAKS